MLNPWYPVDLVQDLKGYHWRCSAQAVSEHAVREGPLDLLEERTEGTEKGQQRNQAEMWMKLEQCSSTQVLRTTCCACFRCFSAQKFLLGSSSDYPWSVCDPQIWARCVWRGKHLKLAGQWILRTWIRNTKLEWKPKSNSGGCLGCHSRFLNSRQSKTVWGNPLSAVPYCLSGGGWDRKKEKTKWAAIMAYIHGAEWGKRPVHHGRSSSRATAA